MCIKDNSINKKYIFLAIKYPVYIIPKFKSQGHFGLNKPFQNSNLKVIFDQINHTKVPIILDHIKHSKIKSPGHPGPHHPGLPQPPPQTQQPTTAQVGLVSLACVALQVWPSLALHVLQAQFTLGLLFYWSSSFKFLSLRKTETATWKSSTSPIASAKRTSMRRLPRLDKAPLARSSRPEAKLTPRRLSP